MRDASFESFEDLPTTPEEVRQRCFDEIEMGLLDVASDLENGNFEGRYEPMTVGLTVVHMADRAAAVEDLPTAEKYIEVLARLPLAFKDNLARVCLCALAAGSEKAFNLLCSTLEAERAEMQVQIAEDKNQSVILPGALHEVMLWCADNEVPPDHWTASYACNKEQRWLLLFAYRSRQIFKKPDETEAQQQRDMMIDELATDATYSPHFVVSMTWQLLGQTKDAALRVRLGRRFIQALPSVACTPASFRQLTWVATRMMKDPQISDARLVDRFGRVVTMYAKKLIKRGFDEFEVANKQLPWRLALKQRAGVTPQEFVEALDYEVANLLAFDIPDDSAGMHNLGRNRKYVVDQRDDFLATYSKELVDRGDFENARYVLNQIGSSMARGFALKECLEKAQAAEQLALVRPDDLTLALEPELQAQFAFAETRVAGNWQGLANQSLEFARTIKEGNSYVKQDYLKDTLAALARQDASAARSYAREALAIMRAAGVGYVSSSELSNYLIQAGDAEEPRRAYEQIQRSSLNESYRLLDMWWLARALSQDKH